MRPSETQLSEAMLDAAVELLHRSGGGGAVRVQGASMLPTLRAGSRLAIHFAPGALERGDLLLFRQGSELVVHRLIGEAVDPDGRRYLRTRGDGVPRLDPRVDPRGVVGVAVAAERPDGWREVRGGGAARAYAVGVALHDLFWAALHRAAGWWDARAGGRIHWRLRAQPHVAALDRGLLRLADRLLFARCHPRIAEPPEAATAAGPHGPGAGGAA